MSTTEAFTLMITLTFTYDCLCGVNTGNGIDSNTKNFGLVWWYGFTSTSVVPCDASIHPGARCAVRGASGGGGTGPHAPPDGNAHPHVRVGGGHRALLQVERSQGENTVRYCFCGGKRCLCL